MQIEKDESEAPVRGEAGLLLLLLVFALCGMLTWTGMFFIVKWSISTAWTAMVAHQAAALSAPIPPALSAAPAAARP
jgi:hypothetical protein